ncbi:MAG: hypothetical protein KDD69_09635, partial [Bdellovibrionales bacterium]|nr:hypothetical protein [Bdellovibrionales bacterium]
MLSAYDIYYSQLNFPLRERIDPLFEAIGGLLGLSASPSLPYFCWQLAIAGLGMAWLLAVAGAEARKQALGASLLLAFALLVLGADPFSWRWHYFPALFAAYLSVRLRSRFSVLCCYVLLLWLWIVTAGSLGPFG